MSMGSLGGDPAVEASVSASLCHAFDLRLLLSTRFDYEKRHPASFLSLFAVL